MRLRRRMNQEPVDNIQVMMVVWRIRGKIIRTVLCCIVYQNCTQLYARLYEQFLHVNRCLLVYAYYLIFYSSCSLVFMFLLLLLLAATGHVWFISMRLTTCGAEIK